MVCSDLPFSVRGRILQATYDIEPKLLMSFNPIVIHGRSTDVRRYRCKRNGNSRSIHPFVPLRSPPDHPLPLDTSAHSIISFRSALPPPFQPSPAHPNYPAFFCSPQITPQQPTGPSQNRPSPRPQFPLPRGQEISVHGGGKTESHGKIGFRRGESVGMILAPIVRVSHCAGPGYLSIMCGGIYRVGRIMSVWTQARLLYGGFSAAISTVILLSGTSQVKKHFKPGDELWYSYSTSPDPPSLAFQLYTLPLQRHYSLERFRFGRGNRGFL